VRDREGWRAALAVFARRTDGRLDVLVNNAGIGCMGFLEALSEAEVDDQIDINLKGVINGCRAGIALLAATPGSMVVNMASVAGVAASARMSVYAATKFAVRGLSEALELEYSRLGVGVRCIMPWFLDTAILDKTASGNQDLRAMLKAGGVAVYRVEEASEAIWRAVHGQAREHMVGAQARRLALLKRFAPGLVRKRLLRQIAGR
jgi:short-subunit dehydrogenase